MTAEGRLVTTAGGVNQDGVGGQRREERSHTSSSTGGPIWVKPISHGAGVEQENLRARIPQTTITVVTRGGVMRTVAVVRPILPPVGGHAWIRRADADVNPLWEGSYRGAAQEVTPFVTPVAAPPVETENRGNVDDNNNPVADLITIGSSACEVPVTTAIHDVVWDSQGGIELPLRPEAVEAPWAPAEVNRVGAGGPLSMQSRRDLSSFIATAVLPRTNRVYEKEWAAFKAFVKKETGSDDPFLTECTDDEKASLVALMMMRRHEAGKRGKAATAFTAAVRQMYARMMRATTFFDSSIIATARTSCLMKPSELRALKDSGPAATVKLPICEGMLTDLRVRSWPEGWSDESKKLKSAYVGTMYGFETAGRISEFTHCERDSQDHCARVDDFTFTVELSGTTKNVLGSGLTALRLTDSVQGRLSILECRVRTVSSKGKIVVKPKLIGRRSTEEAEFLDDLAAWLTYSGTNGKDEAFSYRKGDGNTVHLTGRTVRDEIKKICSSNGLPPDYFSAHSLRKGAITHMRAQGATEDDRRDRGNYAAGSAVMNGVYDYATGLGPLASNSLEGGHRLDKKDLKRMIPPGRKSV